MPVLKRRSEWMKIYRPTGTLYAHGQTLKTPELAVASAFVAFEQEFKRPPTTHESFVEVLGVTGGWAATVLEITEKSELLRRTNEE